MSGSSWLATAPLPCLCGVPPALASASRQLAQRPSAAPQTPPSFISPVVPRSGTGGRGHGGAGDWRGVQATGGMQGHLHDLAVLHAAGGSHLRGHGPRGRHWPADRCFGDGPGRAGIERGEMSSRAAPPGWHSIVPWRHRQSRYTSSSLYSQHTSSPTLAAVYAVPVQAASHLRCQLEVVASQQRRQRGCIVELGQREADAVAGPLCTWKGGSGAWQRAGLLGDTRAALEGERAAVAEAAALGGLAGWQRTPLLLPPRA